MESELKLLRRVSKILFMVCFALIVFCIVRWIVGCAEPTISDIFKIAFCTIALMLNYEPGENRSNINIRIMKEKTKERFYTFLWYALCIIAVLLFIAALAADIALYWGKFKFFVLD